MCRCARVLIYRLSHFLHWQLLIILYYFRTKGSFHITVDVAAPVILREAHIILQNELEEERVISSFKWKTRIFSTSKLSHDR